MMVRLTSGSIAGDSMHIRHSVGILGKRRTTPDGIEMRDLTSSRWIE
jgi:hypothetical protein